MNIYSLFIFLSYFTVSHQSFIRNPFIRQDNRKNNTLEHVIINKRDENYKKVSVLSRRDLITLAQIWFTITLFTFPVVTFPYQN
jgi:hypothetical protein